MKNSCNGQKTPNLKCLSIYEAPYSEVGVIWQELQNKDETPSPDIRTASLDPDDLYQDFCTGNGTLEFTDDIAKTCPDTNGGSLLEKYLNREDVKQAIGANRFRHWSVCSHDIVYVRSGASMVPYYEKFFVQKPGLAILVYSGDVDIMTVPFAITQPCLAELDRTAFSTWGPWYVNGWTAGYFQKFDTYTYATVKGAGHEVPGYQTLNAYYMFSRFLRTQTLSMDEPRTSPSWTKILKSRPLKQRDMLRRIYARA